MKYRYTAEEKVILWLDSFEPLTYQQKQKILALSPSAVKIVENFAAYKDRLVKIVPEAAYETMRKSLQEENYLPSLLSNLERKDIFFVTVRSADYPESLSQIPAPPVILYGKGNRALLSGKRFAVVGSRKTLSWAQALTRAFASQISEHFTLVTGLAEGGDAAVIEGALQSEGEAKIISVLAYGLDYVYPAMHANLLQEVCRRGLVLTEHRPDIKPQKYLFPARNRIIAGLAQGVLVVSGSKHSGTSITAGYAAEYGRDVFAFPYNPGIVGGAGCNALLKAGAYPVDGIEDILEYYGLTSTERPMLALTAEEEKVLQYLASSGESHVEELSRACGVPVYLIGGLLSGLEVKGCIARLGGNRYAPATVTRDDT